MKNVSKYKLDKAILIPLFVFAILSVITIYSAQSLLPSTMGNLALKQGIWYILGLIVIFLVMSVGNDFIYRNAWLLYFVGIGLLVALLLFATPINDTKAWFQIPGAGSFQPSEFVKIALIIILARLIQEFNERYKNPTILEEFKFLVKVMIVVLIPSILTFMQPDTGIVLIYLVITLVMLFVSGIRYRWFLIAFGLIAIVLVFILTIYFSSQDLFIKIFGTDFFLRVDRILDWSNSSGYQLENALGAIGSGGLFGHGFNNTPIYFPEPQTDFIFAVFASNFGLIGSAFLIILILFFDIKLINVGIKSGKTINKYVMAGIIGMLLYQQFQNMGMTIGIMPITGITLPFISYGGSSLLSYMIIAGLAFNIANSTMRYTNG